MTQMYECDCGARYSSPAGVEACQLNYHGKPNPHVVDLENKLDDLVTGVRLIANRLADDVDTVGAAKGLLNLLEEVDWKPRSGG